MEDAINETIWYMDLDEDGHRAVSACDAPSGYVTSNDDCDDSSATNPSATEQCNDIDDNCDGDIDEAGALVLSTYYADLDGDGFGDADSAVDDCAQPVWICDR